MPRMSVSQALAHADALTAIPNSARASDEAAIALAYEVRRLQQPPGSAGVTAIIGPRGGGGGGSGAATFGNGAGGAAA